MQPSRVLSSSSPSSNSSLADIAARVVEEFRAENIENANSNQFLLDDHLFCALENHNKAEGHLEQNNAGDEQDEEEEEFEFAFVPRDADLSLISADQIFCNGQIRPVFNPNLLLSGEQQKASASATPQKIRLPLRELLISEDRDETPSSCSSSEADELEGIPEGTYCVWRPKAVKEEASPTPGKKCKKSNSTGSSSKRWRLRDLVHRSNSHGKDTFVFLSTPSFRKVAKPAPTQSSKSKTTEATHHTKNRGDNRRSYLPYRQHLLGFFANVNGLSRNL